VKVQWPTKGSFKHPSSYELSAITLSPLGMCRGLMKLVAYRI
jgi:hypothetical protein